MAATTTICIEPEVKEQLKGLRIHEQETFNSVVKRLIKNAYDDEPLTDEDIKAINDGLREYKEGKTFSEEEVWAEIERERAEKQKAAGCIQ